MAWQTWFSAVEQAVRIIFIRPAALLLLRQSVQKVRCVQIAEQVSASVVCLLDLLKFVSIFPRLQDSTKNVKDD